MDRQYNPPSHEEKIYAFWEKKGVFKAKVDRAKKPFSIILPPPNANADLHMGHAMYVYEDMMIRYHRLRGFEVLWLPGADHAGFETQYVFEKHLQKQGQSRFDFPRETLFRMIWDFSMKNKETMENQLRRLGFALDWSRKKFTMDEDIVKIVYQTFKQMFEAGLIYREKRLVNYCVKDGTSFSDLEVVDKEIERDLYFIAYPLIEGKSIVVATTRPETLLGDVAVMVNSKDKRYKKLVGKTALLPITSRKIPIVADSSVDMKFGTGAVKVTPSHDFVDFEVGKKHHLDYPSVISFAGKIQNTKTEFDGLSINEARKKIVMELKERELLVKVEKHRLVLKTCYKCGRALEPLLLEQWYVRIRPLADKAKVLVVKNKIKIFPKKFKKALIHWLDKFHDWNISRQIVWGIRIPAWQCQTCYDWVVAERNTPTRCNKCGGKDLKQDRDTFDTWFSSAQWPFATLLTQGKSFFDYFYPTSVMETGYEILPWWVARMIMIGNYVTKKPPFQTVFLHGMVRDKKGQKMSKSRGNVINPMDMIEKYGADALRSALIFQTKEGGDQVFSEDKIRGMRNFVNKVWNIGRFIYLNSKSQNPSLRRSKERSDDEESQMLKDLKKEFSVLESKIMKNMEAYKFSYALGEIYEFLWHRLADFYIEKLKEEIRNGKMETLEELKKVYLGVLVLLHPFVPFVTEAIWKEFNGETSSILNENG